MLVFASISLNQDNELVSRRGLTYYLLGKQAIVVQYVVVLVRIESTDVVVTNKGGIFIRLSLPVILNMRPENCCYNYSMETRSLSDSKLVNNR